MQAMERARQIRRHFVQMGEPMTKAVNLSLKGMLAVSVSCLAVGLETPVAFGSALNAQQVESEPLSSVLRAIARANSVEVMFAPELVEGLDANTVSSSGDARTDFTAALEGTGLTVVERGGVYVVELEPARDRSAASRADVGAADTIVVRGTALTNLQSIDAKRESNQISEFIFADEIGTLPDYNLSDAIRRVAGVNTVFDEDEGRYIAMRGLDADFTYVSVDGAPIAALDLGGDLGGGRRVLLEAVPSFVVAATEIRKSMSADDDGQGIGGQVDLVTRSAFQRDEPFLSVGGSIGYYDSTDYPTSDNGPSLRFDGAWSRTFGDSDQFGLVLSGSYMFKDRDQERMSPGRYTYRDTDGDPVADPAVDDIAFASPRFIVQRGYRNEIQRIGGMAKFEHRPNDRFEHSVTLQYFTQIDDEERGGTYPNAGSVSNWNGETYDVTGADVTSRIQVWDIEKSVSNFAYAGQYDRTEDTSFDFRANISQSRWTEDVPRTAFFTSRIVDYTAIPGNQDVPVQFMLAPDSPYFDPSQYNRFDARWRLDDETETVVSFGGNIFHNVAEDDSGLGFQAGFSFRNVERDFDRDSFRYRQGDDFSLSLTDFLLDAGTFTPERGSAPLFIHDTRAIFDLIRTDAPGSAGQFRLDANWSDNRSLNGDYVVEESVLAAYAMAVHEGPRHRLEAGLRFEQTDVSALTNGNDTMIEVIDGHPPSTIVSGQLERGGDYVNVLPSMAYLYDVTDQLRLRSAFSETIGRPSFRSISGSVDERFDEVTGITTIVEGNPNLEPRVARNYDLSLEYYFDEGRSLASVGVFHKDIRNDIFVRTSTLNDGALIITRPENVETSWLSGIEFQFVQSSFDFLPGPLTGLGASANMTFITGEISIDETTEFDYRLEQPEFLMNASVFYRRGDFEGKLTYNRTGEQPRAVDVGTPYLSRWEQPFDQLDANLDWDVSDRMRVRVQARNLLNEVRVINEGPDQSQIWDYSVFGPQYWIGLRFAN